jgi:hypothetical protein
VDHGLDLSLLGGGEETSKGAAVAGVDMQTQALFFVWVFVCVFMDVCVCVNMSEWI